jgi:hypothetical protein
MAFGIGQGIDLRVESSGEDMQKADIRTQWEGAAPGWARWEATVATWMEPATEAMLTMAGVVVGVFRRSRRFLSAFRISAGASRRFLGANGHLERFCLPNATPALFRLPRARSLWYSLSR